MPKKVIYLDYLFCDNRDIDEDEAIRGILRESVSYGKDPDAEYIPRRPFRGFGSEPETRRRGDGFD